MPQGGAVAEASLKRGRPDTPTTSQPSRLPPLPSSATDEAAEAYERAYVHEVYDAIAPHFSATRFKAWPRIRDFLESLPSFALVADVGCGNGKYFASAQRCSVAAPLLSTATPAAPSTAPADGPATRERGAAAVVVAAARETAPARRFLLGMDINLPLLRLTQRRVADPNFESPAAVKASPAPPPPPVVTESSARKGSATPPRAPAQPRAVDCDGQQAVKGRPRAGRCAEGGAASAGSRRSAMVLDEMPRTDVLLCDARCCPLRPGIFDAAISIAVIHHYATPARRAEAVACLLRLVRPTGGRVLMYVWAREGNEARPKFRDALDAATGDTLVRWEMNAKFDAEKRTFQRYYHLFRQGELEELCQSAAARLGAQVVVRESFFDKENWCVLVERVA